MMCCMIVRADIAEIPSYIPGKRLADALKLSSNEVTHPPLPAAVAAMAEAAAAANRYPDMGHGSYSYHRQAPEAAPRTGCGGVRVVGLVSTVGADHLHNWG